MMKYFLMFGLFVSASVWATPVVEDELPSCEELAEIADVFDDVRAALEEVGKIKEDSELDVALGECVTALEELGRVEAHKALNKAVKRLAEAWEKMDWEKFGLALDSVIANLDRIRREDCD